MHILGQNLVCLPFAVVVHSLSLTCRQLVAESVQGGKKAQGFEEQEALIICTKSVNTFVHLLV